MSFTKGLIVFTFVLFFSNIENIASGQSDHGTKGELFAGFSLNRSLDKTIFEGIFTRTSIKLDCGILFTQFTSENFGIKTGLNYYQKGTRTVSRNIQFGNNTGKQTLVGRYTLHCLAIPLIFQKYSYFDKSTLAGLKFSFAVADQFTTRSRGSESFKNSSGLRFMEELDPRSRLFLELIGGITRPLFEKYEATALISITIPNKKFYQHRTEYIGITLLLNKTLYNAH